MIRAQQRKEQFVELVNLKDSSERVSFAQAVKQGIGKEQGLFFVESIEAFTQAQIEELLSMDLVTRSQKILRHLIGSDEMPNLESIIADAFNFKAPLVKADDHAYCLELFHGPTLAFKDFGARFMARVLSSIIGSDKCTILTATSGDTGAAVADAFYHQDKINVVVLYPKGMVSPLQESLIATLGDNIKAVEVNAPFDNCQDMVKTAFDDLEFKQSVGLNSANSINVSRLLAQVCYYFEAASQLSAQERSKLVFSVPCGNFGNITAGLIAKALGLQCRFVIACNANDTVPRYLSSGNWDPHKTIATISNAMDISRPNNWPRVEALCKIMGWSLSDFDYGSVSDEVTKQNMKALYEKTGYILEPHASVAHKVLCDNLKDGEVGIFLGTAHPAKFKEEVDATLGIDIPLPKPLADRMNLEKQKKLMDADFATLKSYMLNDLKLGD